MSRTIVACHAHPDDEAVLTAGTMARAAAAGHRVVLVLATDGGLGGPDWTPAAERERGARRLAEAHESARILRTSRVVYLGYADSGAGDRPAPPAVSRPRFVDVPTAEAAARLAAVLDQEAADVLLSYDERGGYGHPDHVHVHDVAAEAAGLAGTPRVLQAVGARQRLSSLRTEITHRIQVRPFVAAKRAALRAHASQTAPRSGSDRTLALALRLPAPVHAAVFGREWFIDPEHEGPPTDDICHGLR